MARAKRSRAEWSKVIGRYRASGQTADVFARRNGLNVSTLRWWSAELGKGSIPEDDALGVREVVVAPRVALGRDGTFELVLGALSIRFEVGTDPVYVAAVAAVLVEAGRGC